MVLIVSVWCGGDGGWFCWCCWCCAVVCWLVGMVLGAFKSWIVRCRGGGGLVVDVDGVGGVDGSCCLYLLAYF